MVIESSISECLQMQEQMPIIDVRSPGEFQRAHIPGALNIPLFTDQERAIIGTAYKQESPERAIELGYEFVNPKKERLMAQAMEASNDGRAIIHCWRGGMRSRAFSEELLRSGAHEVHQVQGGYKAFRNHVLEFFKTPFILRILGGYTGSGKTLTLLEMAKQGIQVVDLEGLASHMGSAFGGDTASQPTTEHFENLLYDHMQYLDTARPIWLEDESHTIGKVRIPMDLYRQMKDSPVTFLEVPKEERAKLLVQEYTHMERAFLETAIQKISKRLGGQATKEALEYLQTGNYFEVAMICLHYYDKYYKRSLEAIPPGRLSTLEVRTADPASNCNTVLKQQDKESWKKSN